MSVIGLHGIPGSGKTLGAVGGIALKTYKKDNRLIKRLIRRFLRVPIRINTVYSNFPILLDKKRKIYSNIVSIDDLNNHYSFYPNATIILDEIQAYYDSSKDFKQFPRNIATFFQFHRHFGIKNIYLISQSPSRVVKYLREICGEYQRIKKYIKIPILHIGFIYYRKCHELEHYFMAFTRSKEQKRMYDIKSGFYIFNYKKVYSAYKSRYLEIFNRDKPLLYKSTYKTLDFPKSEYDYLNERLFGVKQGANVHAMRENISDKYNSNNNNSNNISNNLENSYSLF